MKRNTQRVLVATTILLSCGLALAGSSNVQRAEEKRRDTPVSRPFKLTAAGQIDTTTGEIQFGGVASHLGLYTATGFLNPADFTIFGTIEAANGDTLDFDAAFAIGPIGEIQATFEVTGGTGRFANAVGEASGPVMLDPDFSFLIRAVGDLGY